jgi:hypothetical protein
VRCESIEIEWERREEGEDKSQSVDGEERGDVVWSRAVEAVEAVEGV